MMRAAAAGALTAAGMLLAAIYPLAYWVALGVCVLSLVLLAWAWHVDRASSPSLRHALLGAFGGTVTVAILAVLATVGDLPLEVRVWLRLSTAGVATASSLYWLVLLATGAFREP